VASPSQEGVAGRKRGISLDMCGEMASFAAENFKTTTNMDFIETWLFVAFWVIIIMAAVGIIRKLFN